MKCASCKASHVPRAQHLPKIQFNHFKQVSLGATSAALNAGLPELSEHDSPSECDDVVVTERTLSALKAFRWSAPQLLDEPLVSLNPQCASFAPSVRLRRPCIHSIEGQSCVELDENGECFTLETNWEEMYPECSSSSSSSSFVGSVSCADSSHRLSSSSGQGECGNGYGALGGYSPLGLDGDFGLSGPRLQDTLPLQVQVSPPLQVQVQGSGREKRRRRRETEKCEHRNRRRGQRR